MNDKPPAGQPDELPDKTQIVPQGDNPAAAHVAPVVQPVGRSQGKTAEDTDLAGTALGSYQLIRKIAQGGMGQVYEALQTTLDRKVALKILTDELAHRPEFLRRFEREAKAAAALNHPNIVQVYDFSEVDGRLFLVMEFVEGQDLSARVREMGQLPVPEALLVVEQAALALRAAHHKSIIHRDIKPANILRTRDGLIKVSDLGLAKVLTDQTTELTLTGAVMGSPHFLAPEQASGARHVDHRADIYSLGITLFFLLTGRYAYEGATPYSIVLAHATAPLPSAADFGIELPAVVEAFIQKLSAKKPEDRYQSYDALLADLERVKNGLPLVTLTKPGGLSVRQKGLLAAVAVVLLALILAYAFILPVARLTRKPEADSKKSVTADATRAAIPQLPELRPNSGASFENSLGMKFKQVGAAGEQKLLYAAIWKTRVKDFSAFVAATGYDATEGMVNMTTNGWKQLGHNWKDPGFEQTPDHPVCGVSWLDAAKFCEWLTRSEREAGRIGARDEYRLPTDAEWSILVGTNKYPWGNQWPPPQGAGNYADADPDIRKRKINHTLAVGRFNPNLLGLYDVGGNLWEWCSDWYRKEMNSEEARKKYALLEEDSVGQTLRVLRGASWNDTGADRLSSAFRNGIPPGTRSDNRGFRCVFVGGGGSR
jgi:serine/threonine protein kinase